MPSSYTPNFNLNQWEATDKVERIDFNADNAKIDAALRGAYPELLKTITSGEMAKKVSFEFPGIDWTRYAYVVFEIQSPAPISFFVRFNGGGRMSYEANRSTDNSMAQSWQSSTLYRMICLIFYQDNLPMQIFGLGVESCMGLSDLPIREIHTMELEAYDLKAPASAFVPAGVQVSIWGIQ